MGKIIGKSALCFAGLFVASWLVKALTDWLFIVDKPTFLTLLNMLILQYILWLLLPAAYSYIMYRLFINIKRYSLTIVINGIFLIAQFIVLAVINAGEDIMLLSFYIAISGGAPVVMLGLMFQRLALGRINPEKPVKSKPAEMAAVTAKSALCFFMLTAASIGFDKLHNYLGSVFGVIGLVFETPLFFIPIYAVSYAFGLYRLLKSNKRRKLILIINSWVIIVICGFSLVFPEQFNTLDIISPIVMTIFMGNPALLTIVLAYIFNSVEKRGQDINSAMPIKPMSGTGFQDFQSENDPWVE